MGNPIMLIDPTGMEAENWIGKKDKDGRVIWKWDESVKDESELHGDYTEFKSANSGYIFPSTDRGPNGEILYVQLLNNDWRYTNSSITNKGLHVDEGYVQQALEQQRVHEKLVANAQAMEQMMYDYVGIMTLPFSMPVGISLRATLTVAKSLFLRGGLKQAAKTGGQLLLKPGAANLTQKGLDHIVARHWFTSGAKGAGKFAEGTTGAGLKSMINTTTTQGAFRANTMGRAGTIAEYNFGRVIGTTSGGAPASSMRVVIGANGNVITAFPF